MNAAEALAALNGSVKINLPLKEKWRAFFIQASLHMRGYQPKFRNLSKSGEAVLTPTNWGSDEYDYYFDNFIFSRHPRENALTREWRKSQYRPLTQLPLLRLLTIVKEGLFAENQYQLSMKDGQERDYLYGMDGNGLDVFEFVNRNMGAIVEDPNGYIATMPQKSRLELINQDGKIPLKLKFFGSAAIVGKDEESLLFKEKEAAYLFDKNSIYSYSQVKGLWVLDDVDGYYTHLMNTIPAVEVGGLWNSEGFWTSFFAKAFPACDDFIAQKSGSDMVDKEASHPYIVLKQSTCSTCNGVGKIEVGAFGEDEHRQINCVTCSGSGFASVNPADRIYVPADEMDTDAVKIVNPDVDLNTYHLGKVDGAAKAILDALDLLHTVEAQSGVAKAVDRDKLYMMLGSMANRIYDVVIRNTIQFALEYRNRTTLNNGTVKPANIEFVLIKPTKFQIQTSADLMLEYAESAKASTPGFFRKKLLLELSDKRFAGDSLFIKKAEIITELDDLCVYSVEEITTMAAAGHVGVAEITFSRKLPWAIDKVIREKSKDWFKDAGFEDIYNSINKVLPIPGIEAMPEPLTPEQQAQADEVARLKSKLVPKI